MARVKQQAIDQRGLKTLVIWSVWLLVCAAVFVMLYDQPEARAFVQHDRTRITWIIIGVFVFGVLLSLVQAALLTAEWFRAYRLEAALAEKGLAGVNTRRCRRVVERFFAALRAIRERGGEADLQMLVDVEFAAQHRMSRAVALFGNLLITMGLIGTVLGMTLTLTGLTGAIHSIGEDQARMMEGLHHAMQGMGVAFYTTLLGSVLGGVLLRVFAWITDASVESLEDRLLRACMVHGQPVAGPEAELARLGLQAAHAEARMRELRDLLERNREAMRAFAEEVGHLQARLKDSAESEELLKSIAVHRHYARLMAYEVQLQRRLGGFRAWLFERLGIRPGGEDRRGKG